MQESLQYGKRGVSLIDAIVGVALLLVVFLGLFGLLRLSIEVVVDSKARVGALALAQERIEFLQSLAYDAVGTVGGIPSGSITQSEVVVVNGVTYTRRTLVQYVDAPEDGLDSNDENGLTADYKRAKVELSWDSHGRSKTIALTTTIAPPGIETIAGGGTLSLNVFDATGSSVPSAQVHIVNTSTDPTVDVTTFTNASGVVLFPGSPAATSYEISVTKQGYSSAQTYTADATNTNPNPGHLTVSAGQTTSLGFGIDVTGDMTVRTWEPVTTGMWQDIFNDTSNIAVLASTTVFGGNLVLIEDGGIYRSSGSVLSSAVGPEYLVSWDEVSWADVTPENTAIVYRIYYVGSGDPEPVPESDLAGNAAGFTTPPIDISGISTTTYSSLRLYAEISTSDTELTPSIDDWSIAYVYGPTPLPDIVFTMRGAKTIGQDGTGASLYKYDVVHDTGASASVAVSSVEWDAYTMSVDEVGIGYDIAESCTTQPVSLSPGESHVVDLSFVAHSEHSLLVDVRDDTGTLVSAPTINLYRSGYDNTQIGSQCGQAFWGELSEGTVGNGTAYSLRIGKTGFGTTTISGVDISGTSYYSAIITP